MVNKDVYIMDEVVHRTRVNIIIRLL